MMSREGKIIWSHGSFLRESILTKVDYHSLSCKSSPGYLKCPLVYKMPGMVRFHYPPDWISNHLENTCVGGFLERANWENPPWVTGIPSCRLRAHTEQQWRKEGSQPVSAFVSLFSGFGEVSSLPCLEHHGVSLTQAPNGSVLPQNLLRLFLL